MIADLQAQLDYLKQKLFGSGSERRNDQISGQMNLFDTDGSDDEKLPVIIEPEIIEVKAYKRSGNRKLPMMKCLQACLLHRWKWIP